MNSVSGKIFGSRNNNDTPRQYREVDVTGTAPLRTVYNVHFTVTGSPRVPRDAEHCCRIQRVVGGKNASAASEGVGEPIDQGNDR